jgi:Skp family chaperone for outer membrane proteins
MRHQVTSPIVVAVLAALLGYSWAQSSGVHGADESRTTGFPVAVVDISKVFSGFRRLTERKEEHQRQLQRAEEAAKSRVEEIKQLQGELKTHKEGSAEHNRISEELKTKAQSFEVYRREIQQTFTESQSKIMLWAYERVVEQVQQYADGRGIKLVIQFNPIPGEGKSPQEIVGGLNRQVIYQNALDITDDILQALN